MTRASKLETANLDDGSGNKKATLTLFGRFIGKKAPSNALKDWVDAQATLADRISRMGYLCDKPGIKRVPRDKINEIVEHVNEELGKINELRDDFIRDTLHLKTQILDSYRSDACHDEVERALNRWQPVPARMEPVFGVTDLAQGTGLVASSQVQEAIVKSELATKKSMVSMLEDEIIDVLERCEGAKRIRSQTKDIEGLLTKLAPVIREFSDSPDLVEKLDAGLDVLQNMNLNPDVIKSEAGQEHIKKGLAIFSAEDEVVEENITPDEPSEIPDVPDEPIPDENMDAPDLYDEAGGYAHTPDEPEPPEQEDEPEQETTTTTTSGEETLEW